MPDRGKWDVNRIKRRWGRTCLDLKSPNEMVDLHLCFRRNRLARMTVMTPHGPRNLPVPSEGYTTESFITIIKQSKSWTDVIQNARRVAGTC